MGLKERILKAFDNTHRKSEFYFYLDTFLPTILNITFCNEFLFCVCKVFVLFRLLLQQIAYVRLTSLQSHRMTFSINRHCRKLRRIYSRAACTRDLANPINNVRPGGEFWISVDQAISGIIFINRWIVVDFWPSNSLTLWPIFYSCIGPCRPISWPREN